MTDTKVRLEDWLDDLCVRFIINLPKEELESVERICFQVEEAQWFYEDFIRPLDPQLPSLSLRNFCLRIFQHCPLLSGFSLYHHSAAFSEFLAYKTRVPVRGAILLNEVMDQVILVKGWKKGANWSFPRGKINKDEKDVDCAIREVYEETGYDVRSAGLISDEADSKFIEVVMRDQNIRLYVFRNVPMGTVFEPKTRKEISKVQWHFLSELPAFKKQKSGQNSEEHELATNANKFYMVAPFLAPLKKWINQQKRRDVLKAQNSESANQSNKTFTAVPGVLPATALEAQIDQAPTAELQASSSEDRDSARLRRMLSIQRPSQEFQGAVEQKPAKNQTDMLLSMLRNSSSTSLPRTPADQVSTFAPPPKSPKPQHSQKITGSVSQPPQFPTAQHLSARPERLSQPSRPAEWGAFPYHSPRNSQHDNPAHLPAIPNIQPAYPQSTSMAPTNATGSHLSGPYSGSGPAALPHQPTYNGASSQPWNTRPSLNPQASNSRPTVVPSASQLPAPNLSAHSLSLLGMFKNGKAPEPDQQSQKPAVISTQPSFQTVTSNISDPAEPKPISHQQSTLLNLFRSGPTGLQSGEENQVKKLPQTLTGPESLDVRSSRDPHEYAQHRHKTEEEVRFPAFSLTVARHAPVHEPPPGSLSQEMPKRSEQKPLSSASNQRQKSPRITPNRPQQSQSQQKMTILARPGSSKRNDVPLQGNSSTPTSSSVAPATTALEPPLSPLEPITIHQARQARKASSNMSGKKRKQAVGNSTAVGAVIPTSPRSSLKKTSATESHPKPFHPQILQRPKPEPSSASNTPASPPQSQKDRQAKFLEYLTSSKDALDGSPSILQAKTTAPTSDMLRSTVESNAAAAKSNEQRVAPSAATALSPSWAAAPAAGGSSVVLPPRADGRNVSGARRTGEEDVTSRKSSTVSSPILPQDRSFMLSYLQEVAKGGR